MSRAVNHSAPPLPPASARSLLLTVLGEFAYPDDEAVWTTVLIRVLGGLGVESHAVRQAINRSAAAGWIDSERSGRAVRWRLAAPGREVVDDGLKRAAEYLARPAPWDGRWLVLLVSLPQQARTERKRLYGGLTWLRMGNPVPGVWLTPHVEAVAELRSLITRFRLADTAISFTGRMEAVGLADAEIVRRAWNLSELAERYRALLAAYRDHEPARATTCCSANLSCATCCSGSSGSTRSCRRNCCPTGSAGRRLSCSVPGTTGGGPPPGSGGTSSCAPASRAGQTRPKVLHFWALSIELCPRLGYT